MRNRFWDWLAFELVRLPEGTILPLWLLVIRSVLFPLDFLRWKLGCSRGYQFSSDTWIIDGVVVAGSVLRRMVEPSDRAWRVRSRIDGVVILEEVSCQQGVDSGCRVKIKAW